jgi:hypothetical protein
MDTLNYDWKKHAAQVTADDSQIERAFMDQAYQFLANKGGALMKDPYRLGFEIVHKNDTNTRMVGIFAFRVGKTLLYVPVFFLNGEIKGTDLLYRHDSKTFVPLDQEWVKYVISKDSQDMGSGIAKRENLRSPKDINLENIAYPPGGYTSKSATQADPGLSLYKEICDASRETGSLLKRFILEDGGFAAIQKLAAWMDSSLAFTEAVAASIPEDCYMPPELLEKGAQFLKRAADDKPKPTLVLAVGGIDQLKHVPAAQLEKSAANMVKRGYDLWDDRMPDQINPAYQVAHEDMAMIGEPGEWEILMADGTTQKAFVGLDADCSIGSDDDCCTSVPRSVYVGRNEEARPAKVVIVFDEGKKSMTARDGAFGNQQKTITDVLHGETLKSDMSSGESYRIYDANKGTLSEPIHCLRKETKNGIDLFSVHREYGGELTLRRNKDLRESNLCQGVLGGDVYFISIAAEHKKEDRDNDTFGEPFYRMRAKEPEQAIGSSAALRDWALDKGVKKASLYKREDGYKLRLSFKEQSRAMNRPTMAVKLAYELKLHTDVAEELLDTADKDGAVDFLFGHPGGTKTASVVRLLGQPNFQTSRDGEFDVDLDYPQSQVIDTDTQQDKVPMQRIGDAFDPGMGMGPQQDSDGFPKDVLMSSSPEQLAQMASQQDSPQVFEHGVVGSLVQTFDAVSMINKYLPDMEQALDRLGRILFLFYWKPRDFENAYGTDDMTNMENQILSNFRSFGELVLELLKKSETQQKGTVSLAGE